MSATVDVAAGRMERPGLAALLTRPRTSWPAMAGCGLSGAGAFLRFAVPLAAVPALARAAGVLLIGLTVDGVLFKPSPLLAGAYALLTYGLDLISVLILALVIHVFSAVFDGEREFSPALKLAVVGSIPGWLGGVFLILPSLGAVPPLGVLAALATLYGLYVMYLGLPPVMHVRPDRTPVYAGVAILAFLALWGADSLAVAAFEKVTITPAPGASLHAGPARIDLGKAKAQLDQALKADTPVAAVAPDVLESLLPAFLEPGFERQSASSSGAHLGKLSGAMAQGVYLKGDSQITLSIADTGAAGALSQAVRLAGDKHTETGYEKAGEVEGRMTVEKYERSTNTGEYDILVANRFMVQAKGRASVEILKDAVKSVPLDRLEALAKG